MAKVILNAPITTDRYGLHFVNGEAHTTDTYLINKLIRKGVKVEIENPETNSENPEKKTIDEMTIAELKKYATENNIEITSNVKNKADIIEFITNYKKDDGEEKDTQTDDGEENPDAKSDNMDENLDENSNNADGEDNNEEDDGEEPKAE